ncbi:unnamed protein product [Protopolystoma xenopodis]|uniref:Uncharacterized protein n=1 Tax=Protopolystoma xenopodis TaxID=117903 RepID=A0A448X8C0_9PLAT|nr:unnamed protein product [Protopolystoma xenopodis]
MPLQQKADYHLLSPLGLALFCPPICMRRQFYMLPLTLPTLGRGLVQKEGARAVDDGTKGGWGRSKAMTSFAVRISAGRQKGQSGRGDFCNPKALERMRVGYNVGRQVGERGRKGKMEKKD